MSQKIEQLKPCNIRMEGNAEDEQEDLNAYIAELIEFIGQEGVKGLDLESISKI